MKKITAKEAYRIGNKLGLYLLDDGLTFYATDDAETEIYSFDTKKERDDFLKRRLQHDSKRD